MSAGNSLQGLETNLPAINSISFHGASSLKHHVQSKVSMRFFFFMNENEMMNLRKHSLLIAVIIKIQKNH